MIDGKTIVGMTGHAKSGKDTATDACIYYIDKIFRYNTEKFAFADAVKDVCKCIGYTHDQLYNQDLKEIPDETFGITPRKAMQMIGTQMFRQNFGEDIWIKVMKKKIEQSKADIIFVTDVRFINEANFIKSIGGIVVKIVRPSLDLSLPIYQHESELQMDNIFEDITILNKSFDNSEEFASYAWRTILSHLIVYRDAFAPRIRGQHQAMNQDYFKLVNYKGNEK